ncbi:MAG: ferredoxin--NADP reductase [Raineya sp.]|nr:ferredoxin--NADP reductase [Raineya sp.]
MKKYQLRVKAITHETSDTIRVTFENTSNEPMHYKAGQFLTLNLSIAGQTFRRAYSLASSPFTDQDLQIAIKRVKDGKISNLLNDSLKVGDILESLEPMGVFTPEIKPENALQYVFWAGGSGITPIMSMIKSILHQEPKSRILLVYASRNEESIIFKQELNQLEAQNPTRLRIIHILSQPLNCWKGFVGRLDRAKIEQIFAEIPQDLPLSQWMCGPAGMMETIEAFCKEKNLPLPRKESFTASIEESAQRKLDENNGKIVEREVTVKYDGETYRFKVAPNQSILEAALALDIDLPYSCQSGLCTACMGKCVSGKVMMTEDDCLTDQEIQDGVVLTCVAHPLSDDVIIEID